MVVKFDSNDKYSSLLLLSVSFLYFVFLLDFVSVGVCPALYGGIYDLGNVQELDEVWEQSEILNFLRRKEYLNKGDCGTCKSLESCLGGCRAKALTFGGSLNARDPWMCAYNNEEK